jgi:RNA polymerase sigma factor (sigma-70 family)
MPPVGRPGNDDLLRELVERAREGEAAAMEALVRELRDDVYALAVRMLWHPQDAEDATQEILLKIVTRLGTFRGDASVRTWAYRVAANHLLSTRRRGMERQGWTFEAFAEDLGRGIDGGGHERDDPQAGLLAEEVKIGCTLGMLQCLDRPHRLAYVLGDVFDLPSETASEIAGTSPATYRKRLSRARRRIRTFMGDHCGIVNESAPCRCAARVRPAVAAGRVDPAKPLFLGHERLGASPPISRAVRAMEDLHDAAAIFRSHPDFAAPDLLARSVTEAVRRAGDDLLRPEPGEEAGAGPAVSPP